MWLVRKALRLLCLCLSLRTFDCTSKAYKTRSEGNIEVTVHSLVSMEYSANLYCYRLCNNKQVLSKVKNSKIVVMVRQRSDFYDSRSLRSISDDM